MIYLPAPTHADLAKHLGQPLDVERQVSAMAHIQSATSAVYSYVRGRGFDPIGDGDMVAPLRTVVLGLAARSFMNPTGDAMSAMGTLTIRRGLPEFLLIERLTLDNYRTSSA